MLVERLRQAIVIYQVSQQQSIYTQVVQLTLHHISPVKNKIGSVRVRLDRLGTEGDVARNTDESKRRESLYEALEGIKDKLQLLSERSGGRGMTAVCDLADDLRDAIVEYRFSQQKAIYKQNCTLIDAGQT
ncbi:hypothetical protein BDM02DRAFT_3118957 [Thelephora ganbajun]|uniref:Uncharacterized protein n=1 Tax=Thelephora ganbajun TaxID=370292 RepID=A0ACB6Z924_THEGA|nr:hypothetical protein BDM02DRAFT_3118957 [Thelephora ganbajun]